MAGAFSFWANKFMFVVHFLKVKNNNNTLFVNDGHYFLTRRLIMVVVHCIIIVDLLTHHPRHLHLVGQRKLQCRKKVDFWHLYECIGYSRTPVIECGITPTPSKLKARPISGVHPKFIHFCLIKSNLYNSNSPLTWTKCPLLWSPCLVVYQGKKKLKLACTYQVYLTM